MKRMYERKSNYIMNGLYDNGNFLYLVWHQNTETKQFLFFWGWYNNADEALCFAVKRFDTPIVKYEMRGKSLVAIPGSDIIYPSKKIKLLKIRCFGKNEQDKMIRQWRKDKNGIFKSR